MPDNCRTVVRSLPGVRDLLPLAAADPQRYPGLVESAAQGPHARYDIVFAFPRDALILHRDGRVRDARGNALGAKFLDVLDAAWQSERTAAARERVPALSPRPSSALPFTGGWLLFLSYELGAEIEPRLRLPAAPDAALPVALALRCPAAIVVDRVDRLTHLIVEQGAETLLDVLQSDLDTAPVSSPGPLPRIAIDEDAPHSFLEGVEAVQEYLRAGDVFQVNLSREWRARFAGAASPARVFASLRRANPAPFAGLFQWQDWAIVSSSPERLVEVRGNRVSTRPIAGTRPRTGGDDDAARLRELIGHPKERAEHVMLIDLERNDLGRVCTPGSVVVDELMTLESYAHVHHIVSNVSGNLRAGTSPGSVIRAVFPGGTITGCPKVRTMEIIAELEGAGRGAYTGSLGYLDRDGDLDLNILIRTLTMSGSALRFRAGAGIVTDSVANQELEETRAKARGLLRALDDGA
ncbi:MAG TPA: aminodeoxychorismate synthase component I [Rudaea sp.]|jgi:anthranilate synthase component 1